MAGINLGSSGVGGSKTALGIEILQSRKFLGEFIERHKLYADLLAASGWDSSNNRIKYDGDLYDIESKTWVRSAKMPQAAIPSQLEGHGAFVKVLGISQSSDTGFIQVSVEHYSPHIAKLWVDLLVLDLNAEIRKQDVTDAEASINYLREQLGATSLAELKTIFYELIEEQTKTIMLANSRPEYLFRTIDPAVANEKKIRPQRALICIAGVIVGGGLGLLMVFGQYLLRK